MVNQTPTLNGLYQPSTPQGIYGWLPRARDDTSEEGTPPEQPRPQVYRASRDFQMVDPPATPELLDLYDLSRSPPADIRVPSPLDPLHRDSLRNVDTSYPSNPMPVQAYEPSPHDFRIASTSSPHRTGPELILNSFLQPRSMKNLSDVKNRHLNVLFDIRQPPDVALAPSHPGKNDELLNILPYGLQKQPATTPPCSNMRITHPELDWPIIVSAGASPCLGLSPSAPRTERARHRLDYCTILDVMTAIYTTLHHRLRRAEYYSHSASMQKTISLAFYQRCRFMIAHPEQGHIEANGALRVDVLGVNVQFVGLVPTAGYGQFELIMTNRDREFSPPGVRQVDLLLPLPGEPESSEYRGDIPFAYKDPKTNWGIIKKMHKNPWKWNPSTTSVTTRQELPVRTGTALGINLG
ncbi:hypothetical protein K439DRAFT_448444 [Ramaria rubella]|nr:hypothetical protein K439DRAFT_448444 [Ramaria rubella]